MLRPALSLLAAFTLVLGVGYPVALTAARMALRGEWSRMTSRAASSG